MWTLDLFFAPAAWGTIHETVSLDSFWHDLPSPAAYQTLVPPELRADVVSIAYGGRAVNAEEETALAQRLRTIKGRGGDSTLVSLCADVLEERGAAWPRWVFFQHIYFSRAQPGLGVSPSLTWKSFCLVSFVRVCVCAVCCLV